jgi:gentisate 1,2-dioxygenase
VWQVFEGTGKVSIGDQRYELALGDLFAVPSWAPLTLHSQKGMDLFRFSDDPVFAALGLAREELA